MLAKHRNSQKVETKSADYMRGPNAQAKLAEVRKFDPGARLEELDEGYRVTWTEVSK